MIDYDKFLLEMTITCDDCEEQETADGDWSECIEVLKRKGWKLFKDNYGDWTHKCPSCINPSPQEDFQ